MDLTGTSGQDGVGRARTVGRADLVLGEQLGQGGQGTVYRVVRSGSGAVTVAAVTFGSGETVYKEYKAEVLPGLDASALAALVNFLGTAEPGGTDARWLSDKTAWPSALVDDGGSVRGFLMGAVPDRFQFDYMGLTSAHVGAKRLANLEYLLNDDAYVGSVGLSISDRDRVMLLIDLSWTLVRLHRMGIAVGDLSPKNLLFTTEPQPECFLIDCDAMRLGGASVLPQAETPDWRLPAGEEAATRAGDVYKFALLAIRLFARDQSATDPAALDALSPELGALARESLATDPGGRPSPAQWAERLAGVVATASDVATTPAIGPSVTGMGANALSVKTAGATKQPLLPNQRFPWMNPNSAGAGTTPPVGPPTKAGRGLIAALISIAVILLIIIVAVSNSGPNPVAYPNATDSVSYTDTSGVDPATTYGDPSTTYDAPTTATDDTTQASPTVQAFDPSELDSSSTDPTPFTSDALLPQTFTDSKDVEYSLQGSGQHDCISDSMSSDVQSVLKKYGCSTVMTGSYTEDSTTVSSNNDILVSVEIFAFDDAATATSVYDSFPANGSWDFGIWCPKTGYGANPCSANADYQDAYKSSWIEQDYRYVVEATALYTNLSQDSSAKEWTSSASDQAVTAAGPAYYISTQQ